MANQNQEANRLKWHNYFVLIRKYCPWSWSAWRKGLIDIQIWSGQAIPLNHYEARVYTHLRKPRLLKKIAEQQMMLYPSEEWLYSHPQYKRAGTPEPCLIQQDSEKLNSARTQSLKKGQENHKLPNTQ